MLLALTLALASVSLTAASFGTVQQHGRQQFPQDSLDNFNILRHTGGRGPWLQFSGLGLDRDTPEGCTVDQVQLFMRHGERYPTVAEGRNLSSLISRLQKLNSTNSGPSPLIFLKDYVFPIPDESLLETETFSGPYGGYADIFLAGSEARSRYGHLWDEVSVIPFFTASQARVVISSENFARGFIGVNYTSYSTFETLEETDAQGFNSLTPINGCPAYDPDYRLDDVNKAQDQFLSPVLARLRANLPGANLTITDASALMTLCGYELNIRGQSPWCSYFTADEWVAFSYSLDVNDYYYAGPGNPLSSAVGSVPVNASLRILNDFSSDSYKTVFNFLHDTDILILLSGLGIIVPDNDLPINYIPPGHFYKISEIVPMGSRLAIERLSCQNKPYVRLVLNEAVIPYQDCQSGPGLSCPLKDFETSQVKRFCNVTEQCQIPAANQTQLTFYWDWKDSNKYPTTVNVDG